MPRKPDPRSKGIRTVRKHIRPNGRKLRTKENAELICSMIENGHTLAEIAPDLGVIPAAITAWIRDDASIGGAEIATQYARAMEFRAEMMAEELLQIADSEAFMQHPEMANALVTKQRLAVDTRKWLLSKMLPRKYGDRIEVAGDASAPIVTRIELVAVEPASHARVIDNVPNEDGNMVRMGDRGGAANENPSNPAGFEGELGGYHIRPHLDEYVPDLSGAIEGDDGATAQPSVSPDAIPPRK